MIQSIKTDIQRSDRFGPVQVIHCITYHLMIGHDHDLTTKTNLVIGSPLIYQYYFILSCSLVSGDVLSNLIDLIIHEPPGKKASSYFTSVIFILLIKRSCLVRGINYTGLQPVSRPVERVHYLGGYIYIGRSYNNKKP